MTKDEERYQRAVREAGCCVCRRTMSVFTPCEIHHRLRGGRRINEWEVLGLCQPHHRGGVKNERLTSRHPYRRAFEIRYGTEAELLAWTRAQVGKRYPGWEPWKKGKP